MGVVPKEYFNREQAFVKHTILQTYLQRLFMIIGRKELVINYVDCFAGPWSEETPQLDDTSIGISIRLMKQAAQALYDNHGRSVRFRALYIEKDSDAYKKLQEFLVVNDHSPLEADSIRGDYMDYINYIAQWTQGHFTFFFIDPKGWKKVISEETMGPLLRLGKTEFLVNLMYDFVNRAVNIDSLNDETESLLGQRANFTGLETTQQRQHWVVSAYKDSINRSYKGRATHVPVERPGKDRVLYFLVYLTRSPVGISVFKEAAENMSMVQRVIHAEARLRVQVEKSLTGDLFVDDTDYSILTSKVGDNRLTAEHYLLEKLSDQPLLIDHDCWATFLEESDLYPSDLQMAMKELVKNNAVENLDEDMGRVRRRVKKPIKPSWPDKGERWVLK